MNGLSRMLVAATKMALDDHGGPLEYERSRIGVAIGTAFGPVQTSVEYLDEYIARGPSLAPPQLFAESVANAPGSHIAIENHFEGFNLTFTQRESSAMAAAMYACSRIVSGAVGASVVGGVDEINDVTFSVLDRIRALAHVTAQSGEVCRPFDARRNGMILGEGAATLTLETAARGREPYGWFAGFGIAKDPTASISDWGHDAEAVVRAMRDAIADAGITESDIDVIFASANSSVRGDRLEADAIRRIGGGRIPVVVTKGIFGEYAAAGALQLVAAFLSMHSQKLPPGVGFESGDPDLAINIRREAEEKEIRYALVNSISAGGGIISCVIARHGS